MPEMVFPQDSALSRKNGGGGNRTRESVPQDRPRFQDFSACIEFGGFLFSVVDGEVMVYEPGGNGTSEVLKDAIPKLACLLGAARIAANLEALDG